MREALFFFFLGTGLIAASCGQLDYILKSSDSGKKATNNGGMEVSTVKISRNGNMKTTANGLSNDVYFNGNGLHY